MNVTALEKYERLQPFTEQEAWTLFRLAAISEAVGWTLLICGILCKRYIMHGNNDAVLLAGQVHGMIFLAYIIAVIALYSSLRWSRRKTLVAGFASVPPYGSLVFEQWAAYKRRNEALKTYREVVAHAIIAKGETLLAVQPKETGFWRLPSGVVQPSETAEDALKRYVLVQTGVEPKIGRLVYIWQHRHKGVERLEMFFVISNVNAYDEATLRARIHGSKNVDAISFIEPKGNADVRPTFLQTEPVIEMAKVAGAQVKFITGGE